ncbi:hypothetical protein [Streptomyces noursei]|uniref:hypothetical protein n=1 Tax=Streptomyces noursei TaxID=1971 RepID=UPI0013520843
MTALRRRNKAPNTAEVPSDTARRCPFCATVFTVTDRASRQVYCSPACREANRQRVPVQRTCPVCSTEFTTDVSPRRVFCSRECRTKARSSEHALEKRACPVCNDAFEAPKTVRQVYCSPACRKDADRRRGQARDDDRARRLGESPRSPRPVGELPTARPAPRQQPGVRDPLEPTATRNCPHCDQPITIVALLATPEAARPSISSRVPDITPLRRTP